VLFRSDNPEDNQYLDLLARNGLELESTEGCYFVDELASFLASAFGEFVSSPIGDFLALREAEMKIRFQEDAGLCITFKEVAERCLAWESYLDKYKDSPLKKDAERYHNTYMSTLFGGLDNTRVLGSTEDEYERKIRGQVHEAYTFVLEQFPGTQVGRLLAIYYPLLKGTDFTLTDEVEEFRRVHNIEILNGAGFVK
ncbi:MAG: hypothetical protein QG656_1106, partial [Candidatus Hydrogenedentes bacterium]|nr:hypothetical protein [Candidatus Hydrogenedentota bacterium]